MGKESACNAGAEGDTSSIPGLGRSPVEENGNPLWYSSLENPMDRGTSQAIVHRIAKSWPQMKQLSTAQHSTGQWAPSCLRLLGEAPVVSLYPLCA